MSKLSHYIKLRNSAIGCDAKQFECDKYLDCDSCLEDKIKEHDKQIRADAINELKNKIVYHLNDYALQEAPIYQDEDDVANQRPVYLAIKNCINGVIEIAERLKEQK
ncbi:MAG: hypothetical protein SPF36_07950 [Lachnospiraceae bacterium]|nr:hypothetical protein [Lachnospiraceae bacterium]